MEPNTTPAQAWVAHIRSKVILHITYRADTFNIPGGYVVGVTLRFAVTYSVNGGPWTAMGAKARLYSQQHQVDQVQPEGVSRS
jgi:hypothetical protein